MRNGIGRDGHVPARENDRPRVAALVAPFLLLMAGVIVSAPGITSAGASRSTSVGNSVDEKNDDGQADDDQKDESEHDGDDGNHHGNECGNANKDDSSDSSNRSDPSNSRGRSCACRTKTNSSAGHQPVHDDSHHDGQGHGHNRLCTATLTVVKFPNNQHGGNLEPANFQLLVDGQPQDQNVGVTVSPDVHVVSEVDVPGYALSSISCTDDDTLEPVANDSGSVKLSARQRVTCEVVNDDIAPTITVHKEVQNNNGGSAVPSDFHLTLDGIEVTQGTAVEVDANSPITISEEGTLAGYAPTSVLCTSDLPGSPNDGLTVLGEGSLDVTPALAENLDCTITNHDTAPGLTVIKTVVTNDGGNEVGGDFPLQVNGDPISTGTSAPFTAGVALSLTETQKPGYTATLITCVSSDVTSANNFSTPSPDPAALGTVTLAQGESVVCTITNDDIAPVVTVQKVVIGGPKVAADFQMTLGGNNVAQDTAIPVLANTSLEVSEVADPAYITSGVACADTLTSQPLVNPLVLDEGQSAHCIVTNTFKAPRPTTITVVKSVTNNSGGTLGKADFQLQIDGANALQDTPIDVSAGPHQISETARPGYEQTSIVCVDSVSQATVDDGGSITLAVGQQVVCTVSNDDIPAALTVAKQLINNDGGVASPGDFQLQIDGVDVPQNQAQSVSAGLHTVGEVPVPGWSIIAINCTDDVAKVPVIYNAGITLALGQHVTCIVFNDDNPVPLAATIDTVGTVEQVAPSESDPTSSPPATRARRSYSPVVTGQPSS
jgi:hypothetical protein